MSKAKFNNIFNDLGNDGNLVMDYRKLEMKRDQLMKDIYIRRSELVSQSENIFQELSIMSQHRDIYHLLVDVFDDISCDVNRLDEFYKIRKNNIQLYFERILSQFKIEESEAVKINAKLENMSDKYKKYGIHTTSLQAYRNKDYKGLYEMKSIMYDMAKVAYNAWGLD